MPGDRKVVLVVDDEPDVRAYLSTLLEDHGFDTVTAVDGDEAMRKVERFHPDLITLDITMPEKGGVRFYKEIKQSEAFSSIPVIVVTGVSGDSEWFTSTHPGAPAPEGYLSKPIDQRQMLDLARRLSI
jgi:CheY-like chemotaxis protein